MVAPVLRITALQLAFDWPVVSVRQAYFKIYKPKKEEDEDDQPEGLETGGLEEVPDEEESEDEDFEENEK